jgi:stage V sporulation protein B
MGKQSKKSSTSFLVQGSILAIASIVSRIIGLIYRIPLTNIIGMELLFRFIIFY